MSGRRRRQDQLEVVAAVDMSVEHDELGRGRPCCRSRVSGRYNKQLGGGEGVRD